MEHIDLYDRRKPHYDIHWQPDTFVADAWFVEEDRTQCVYCSYYFTEPKPYDFDRCGDPSYYFYTQERLRMDNMKQKHWDTIHGTIPEGWDKEWVVKEGELYPMYAGEIRCRLCNWEMLFNPVTKGEERDKLLKMWMKYHRRVCDPTKIIYRCID